MEQFKKSHPFVHTWTCQKCMVFMYVLDVVDFLLDRPYDVAIEDSS